MAGLGAAAARIEHRRRRLIGKQLGRSLEMIKQALVQRPKPPGRPPDPVGQGRAVELDAFAREHLGLAIERQVIGVFADDDMGDQCLGGQPALDQPRRGRRLHQRAGTGPAGVFGPAHHEHAQLGRHEIEPLGDVLADPLHLALAARAGLVCGLDHRLEARQVRRQRPAIDLALDRR